MTRRTYPKYKPSGGEWLVEIPGHWSVRKLKHISSIQFSNVDKHTIEGERRVRLCNYVDVYYNSFITADLNFMEATAPPAQIAKFALRRGDVIITKDSEAWEDIAVPAYVSSTMHDVLCGYHLAQIRPNPKWADGKYLFRAFCSRGVNDQFRVAATGITRYGLGKYWLDNGLFLVPPVEEQRSIAAFLDRETSRIDALMGKKQRQIELLQEKRAALISHAVTKGLNPNVKMKDSGLEWLGEFPEHWELLQLRRVINKFIDYRGATPVKSDDGIPLITARNIKNGIIDFELSKEFIREEDYDGWMVRGLPQNGDVLITTEAPLGESAIITDTNIALAQRVILLKSDKNIITNKFLNYYFMSCSGNLELLSRATGSTAIGIKASKLKEILVLVPPVSDQELINNYLDQETPKIDGLGAKIQESIDRLTEYRTALISAAVTGKIDVGEAAA